MNLTVEAVIHKVNLCITKLQNTIVFTQHLFLFTQVAWLLVPVGCQLFNNLGLLTVKPASPFLMGSNLTLHCHIDRCSRS